MADTLTRPWGRLDDESGKAYAAFMMYLSLKPRDRSVDNAYRASLRQPLEGTLKAPAHWAKWRSKFDWVERAQAYEDEQSERVIDIWTERKIAKRERDWLQAEALRDIVDGALPNAEQFFERRTTTIRGQPSVVDEHGILIRAGTPDREIITLAFRIGDLARVAAIASKMQSLLLDEPTDNINSLSGAALDAAIERALGERRVESIQYDPTAGLLAGSAEEAEAFEDDEGGDE
jgi:hypothetical protein